MLWNPKRLRKRAVYVELFVCQTAFQQHLLNIKLTPSTKRQPQELRSHLSAQSKTMAFQPQVRWRHTRGPTQERNNSSVQSVTRASHNQILWSHMKEHTQERNHSSVQRVTRASHTQVLWRHQKDSHRQKATCVKFRQLEDTWENPHRRETFSVLKVWQGLPSSKYKTH